MSKKKANNEEIKMVMSYRKLRLTIGVLGMTLPIILAIGFFVVTGSRLEGSISSYYHTIMRNVFVGVICAFAFFLYAYQGYGREDNIVANLAAISAIGVAFFPMASTEGKMKCAPAYLIPENWSDSFHFTFAAVFFLMLCYFSIFLFTKTKEEETIFGFNLKERKKLREKLTNEKKRENWIYIICGVIMLCCILLIALYMILSKNNKDFLKGLCPVYWLESVSLVSFGISWFVKGKPLEKKNKNR